MITGYRFLISFLISLGISFYPSLAAKAQDYQARFEKLSSKKTGINFKNQLREDAQNNILQPQLKS
jgi:enediyne biosynthesis protein E4